MRQDMRRCGGNSCVAGGLASSEQSRLIGMRPVSNCCLLQLKTGQSPEKPWDFPAHEGYADGRVLSVLLVLVAEEPHQELFLLCRSTLVQANL